MNLEQYAVSLLRLMFKSKCKSLESYPCYQDEETKIAFADYTVTYQEQPPNSWFIVFRETFLVHQDMILVPKVYTTLPICILHIVNNDTMEQVPKVFQKVVPYLYTKNKKGYTFVAEAFTGDTYVAASRWKLRLIGSSAPLPCLSRDSPCNSFAIKEIRDYYIPNDKKILFRYSVKVLTPQPATIQVRTSKPDAFIKLQVLENEETMVSSTGKGQAIIPAFHFLKSEKGLSSQSYGERHEELINLGSPDSHTISEGQKSSVTSKTTRKGKEKSSEKEKTAKEKQAPRFEPQISTVHPQQEDPNKPYWILRLVTEHNESELFEVKKDTERADEIRAMKQAWETTEPGRAIKASQARLHYLSGFIKKTSDAESPPISESQTKPKEEVETAARGVKEPNSKNSAGSESKEMTQTGSGSAVWKKWQLTKGLRDVAKSTSSESGGVSSPGKEEREQSTRKENIQTGPRTRSPTILETSPRLIRKALEFMDLSQYVRKTDTDPLLQTDELNQQQAMQKAEEIHQFRQHRTRVLSIRNIDQEERLKLKDEVLDMYKEMQDSLDEARQKIFDIREEYRNKLLEAEHLKLETLAAQEAAMKLETEKMTPAPDTQKKKKGKKK
uniref:Isoform 2 of Androglobin n=2 Tax=Homo sapiens TaxID=9606 RepID=Q8N7X0-2